MIKLAKISSLVSLYPLPQYVVVLEDIDRTHLVPIWIGAQEGNAIALEMQGEKFPRPLTHDLIIDIIHSLGAEVEQVVISDLKENSYYAIIFLRQGEEVVELDARPSDSLAIAVRTNCPVYIDEKVLAKCPPMSGPITEADVDRFKKDLMSMSPEEFFKSLESAPPNTMEPEIHLDDQRDEESADDEDDTTEEKD